MTMTIQQSASRYGGGDGGWGSGNNNNDGRHGAATNDGLRRDISGGRVLIAGDLGIAARRGQWTLTTIPGGGGR